MKYIEYYTMIEMKSDWLYGPWTDEPDKVQWQDATTKLPCLAVRNRSGAWCGYVGVPDTHPLYAKDWCSDDFPDLPSHGGINFSDHCQETGDESRGICHTGGDKVWWLGFDCAHCGDIVPRDWRICGSVGQRYRDFDYVKYICTELATALHLTKV